MTNRKNNNSILFLTTLGVYLGLVLVGATPVLGHAALTRNFELQDEIEVSDDLDKKPDEEKAIEEFASALEKLYRIAADISSSNPEQVEAGSYDLNFFVSVTPRGGSRHFSPSEFNNVPHTFSGRNSGPLRDLYDAFLPRAEQPHENFFVSFGLTPEQTSLRIVLTDENSASAAITSASLAAAISKKKDVEIDLLRRLTYDAAQVSVEGNRIIIVTNLPRASIDPLLATNAK
jgi:hypothetical protein